MQQGPYNPTFILHSFLMAQESQTCCAHSYVGSYVVKQWHIHTDTSKNCLEHK